jgi:hypothetical protein
MNKLKNLNNCINKLLWNSLVTHKIRIHLHLYILIFLTQLFIYFIYLAMHYYGTHSFYDLLLEPYKILEEYSYTHTSVAEPMLPKIETAALPIQDGIRANSEIYVEPPKVTAEQYKVLQTLLEIIAPTERTKPVLNLPPFHTSHYTTITCHPKQYLTIPLTTIKNTCCCNLPIIHYHSNHLPLSSPSISLAINGTVLIALQVISFAVPLRKIFYLPYGKQVETFLGTAPIPDYDLTALPVVIIIWVGILFFLSYCLQIEKVIGPPLGTKHFPVIDGLFDVKKQTNNTIICGACPYSIDSGQVHHYVPLLTPTQYETLLRLGRNHQLPDEKYKLAYQALKTFSYP